MVYVRAAAFAGTGSADPSRAACVQENSGRKARKFFLGRMNIFQTVSIFADMKHHIHILYIAATVVAASCIIGCHRQDIALANGDLLFVAAGADAADRAIDAATSPGCGESFSHVGIVEVCEGKTYVIDATSRYGVSRRPVSDFIGEAPRRADGSAAVTAMRIKASFDAEKAVAAARSHIGEPYDPLYMPDNGRMYCSELIYESFRNADGSHMFEARPMNFRASDGSYPEYWVRLFDSLGMRIPQGVPGTNPNDISRSAILKRLEFNMR